MTHTFEDSGITYFGYIEEDYFVLGSDNNTKSCINRSYNGRIYVPAKCVIDGNTYYIRKLSKFCFFNTAITHLILPYTINFVSHGSFELCYKMEFADLSYIQCTTLSVSVFSNCVVMTNVKLPVQLTKIESTMFHQCKLLRYLTIPPTVVSIHTGSFLLCSSLTLYYCGKHDISEQFDASIITSVFVTQDYNGDYFGGVKVERTYIECYVPENKETIYCRKSTSNLWKFVIFLSVYE